MLPVSVTKIDHKEILTVENQIYPEGLRVHIAETATMKELPINIILGAEAVSYTHLTLPTKLEV